MSTLRVIEGEPRVTVFPDVWGKNVYGIGKATRAMLIVGDIVVSQATLLRVPAETRRKDTGYIHHMKLGGIGSVLTPPPYRQHGYATQLLEDSLEYMSREWGVEGGVLFCLRLLRPWYEERGWKKVLGHVMVDQPVEKMLIPPKVDTMLYGANLALNVDLIMRSLPW
jgi:GNAT superfamily N-acetyltransferase